jgi:uncharacterized membrane protein YcjF (UPF0283 family)
MEIVLGFIGIVIVLAVIMSVMESIEKMFGRVNWTNFFMVLIGGGILLAVIFSFTSEGVFVIIGFYIVLLVFALIGGKFNNKNEEEL